MKVPVLLLVVAVAAACVGDMPTVRAAPDPYDGAPDDVDGPALDPFYEPLSPYGDWWWSDRWGWVYSPHVDAGWRPYTVGGWVWTDDAGWLWVSHEPFGWACFHYGRWVWLDDAGWVWIPGRVWGPAWVVWRAGPHVVGWGPLPPAGVDVDVVYGPWGWVFVDDNHFLAPSIVVVAVPTARNPRYIPDSHVLHHPSATHAPSATPRNDEIDKTTIEHATGVTIRPRRIVDVSDDGDGDDDVIRLDRDRRDDVRVKRVPSVEVRRPDAVDVPGPRARFTPGSTTINRPLAAPTDDDIDRRFDAQRSNSVDDNDRKQVDADKAREKKAADKKRIVPRKVPAPAPLPKSLPKRPSPTPDRRKD